MQGQTAFRAHEFGARSCGHGAARHQVAVAQAHERDRSREQEVEPGALPVKRTGGAQVPAQPVSIARNTRPRLASNRSLNEETTMAKPNPGRDVPQRRTDLSEPAGVPHDEETGLSPMDAGTLSSGYSSQSSSGGTPGDALRQADVPEGDGGGGASPGSGRDDDPALAHAGATAGAAGEDVERTKVESRDRARGRVRTDDEDEGMDGAATVTGVSGVSGGTSGTTRIYNTRK
jgi:hypothetical protein